MTTFATLPLASVTSRLTNPRKIVYHAPVTSVIGIGLLDEFAARAAPARSCGFLLSGTPFMAVQTGGRKARQLSLREFTGRPTCLDCRPDWSLSGSRLSTELLEPIMADITTGAPALLASDLQINIVPRWYTTFKGTAAQLMLDRAKFDRADASLVSAAGPCSTCHKRTGADPDLFAQSNSADMCLDPDCYQKKEAAHSAATLAAAHAAGCTVIDGREAKALMPHNWGRVEGYLRLDDAADSPTDTPLRALIGKAIEASGTKPALLANPHKAGELIAILPTATVAELLKTTEHSAELRRIESQIGNSKKADAEAAKAQAKREYEQAWRDAVLERTWEEIEESITESKGADNPSIKVLRHIAHHYANGCNTDRAKRLCELLGLGKVAPKQALLDYVRETTWPHAVLKLLVMAADAQYQPYWEEHYPGKPSNTGLMLIADDYHVDIDAIKLECKAATLAKVAKPQKPPPANAPAAQAEGGGARGAWPKLKTSAVEAKAQIAAAMQAQGDTNPGADAQGNEGAAMQPVADVAADAAKPSLAVDVPVVVTGDTSRLPIPQQKWAGKRGVITQKVGDRAWMVAFRGRNGGLISFDGSDLVALPKNTVFAADQVAYRGPNGETWTRRGQRPRWVTALLDDGATLDSLKVVV